VLYGVAQQHASNMAGKDTMSHELDGKRVKDRLDDVKYQYSKYGENIAFRPDFPTAANIVNAWMNSPGHRANILDPAFTEISVAKSGRTQATYVCQVFGAPK
jgi:uncharacterized protein YkwD